MNSFRDRFAWMLFALAAVILILILAGAIVQAKERDPDRTILCAMLSRELVRVEIESGTTYDPVLVAEALHYQARPDPALRSITPAEALKRYTTHMQLCEVMIDIVPSLPSVEASGNDAWARSMATLATRFDGTTPATDAPPQAEGWAEACAAEWRTFDPSDGTVVRPASKGGKQRCPLVLVDGAWVMP